MINIGQNIKLLRKGAGLPNRSSPKVWEFLGMPFQNGKMARAFPILRCFLN